MLVQKIPVQLKFEFLYNKYIHFIYVKTVSSNKESLVCLGIPAKLPRRTMI